MPDILPAGTGRNDLADWLELLALQRTGALGVDALHAIGSGLGVGDADVSVGLTTMQRRGKALGRAYPFRVSNGVAARPDAAKLPYATLLLLSPASPLRRTAPLGVLAVHLEQVTAAAMKDVFGPATQVARFGWPSDEGRPPAFPDAIRWLAGKMGTEIGTAYRPPFRRDGGVDVVAWRPFDDGRSGFPVILTQCTLEHDFEHKANDVDLRVWAGWLRLDLAPMTAIAIPTVVAHGEPWNALSARTMVFDRTRLVSLLGEGRELSRLVAGQAWTVESIAGLREGS
jgi:hypothetical protein